MLENLENRCRLSPHRPVLCSGRRSVASQLVHRRQRPRSRCLCRAVTFPLCTLLSTLVSRGPESGTRGRRSVISYKFPMDVVGSAYGASGVRAGRGAPPIDCSTQVLRVKATALVSMMCPGRRSFCVFSADPSVATAPRSPYLGAVTFPPGTVILPPRVIGARVGTRGRRSVITC